MEICDRFCCTDLEDCKELGTKAINFASYHKVCNNHFNFNEKFMKCRFCESYLIITSAEINKKLNYSTVVEDEPKDEFEENFCVICQNMHNRGTPCGLNNYDQIAKNCHSCNIIIDPNSIDYKHCEACHEYIYCNDCLSYKDMSQLSEYYLLNCGHIACSHIYQSDCDVYSPTCSPDYCSVCQDYLYVFKEFHFSLENGFAQLKELICWKCISTKQI